MKVVARYFSILSPLSIGVLAAAWPMVSTAHAAPGCPPPVASDNLPDAGSRDYAYPTFCSIPLRPTDGRTPAEYKSSVVDIRMAGVWLVGRTGPETFSLFGGQAFADQARREAAPPPPMSAPDAPSTKAFIEESRARATPPSRPR
jgi:hypothetical protein